jgi:hypothetical protein
MLFGMSLFAEVAPAKEAGYEDYGGAHNCSNLEMGEWINKFDGAVKDSWVERTRAPDRGHSVCIANHQYG